MDRHAVSIDTEVCNFVIIILCISSRPTKMYVGRNLHFVHT